MERDPAPTLARRLAVFVAGLAIVAAAVPASALAWVGPAPDSPVVGATTAPTSVSAAAPTGGHVIYDSLSGRKTEPVGPEHGISAALAARAAAAKAAAGSAAAETVKPAAKPASSGTTAATSRGTTAARPAPTYRGRNYMWMPALGIAHAVTWYACSASYALSYAAVYRWGCAGTNNVYLMAHAGGLFGPLYTAYYAGRLKAGMLVVYADANARIHYFKLQWWRTTPPDGDVGWAYASQSVSSLTLQTCVGADSSLRLVVRFVEVAKP